MQDDSFLRLSFFIGILLLMLVLEALFPRKTRTQNRAGRWLTNLGLVVINGISLRLLGVISAVSAANYAADQGWGLLAMFPLPLYVDILLGIVLLDAAIYGQHVLSHKIPLLWKLHRVHHADRDIDATTGVRFHPLEIVISMLYKCLVIILLGPLAVAVIAFEIILNASAMFNHANLNIPLGLDKMIRQLFVTPDMHRVHHSIIHRETDSNYGFCLSIWDRLFGTYIAQPQKGHEQVEIGLAEWRDDAPSRLSWSLLLPFK